MLSAVIIARDEADRIEAAIRSVAFADEVLVLDSGSLDGTVERARAAGARVIGTDWPGFVAQKNRGLAEARHDWVLSLDADETLDAVARQAILEALAHPGGCVGFAIRRENTWLGHRLRHGHWRPRPHLRLVRRGHARWGGEDPHDRLIADGPCRLLRGAIRHDPYRNLGEHLRTIDRYSALQARRGSALDVLGRPLWHFFSGWVLRGGVLDGVPGLVVTGLGALHVGLKWSRGHWERR
jgi:glycosyltransferase involved in cell wall biosynthesis